MLRLNATLAGAALLLGSMIHQAAAQAPGLGASIELVDPKVFRVCADPGNMPFSDKAAEGFENKIADLFAQQLGKTVSYVWFPQVIGFARNTLNAFRCDVVMGIAENAELMQNTNPYYHSAYVIAFKPGTGLDGITTLEDSRLADKHIGIVGGTPPANRMAADGLMRNAKPYPMALADQGDAPAKSMIDDLVAGRIDAAVIWGPLGGYFAKHAGVPITVVPLLHEPGPVPMDFRITMGVRRSDQAWKRQLNQLIERNQPEINRILTDYGVPLLDNQKNVITVSAPG